MKELKKYRVKSAYGMYRKGDIIQPTGMLRDELIMSGRIELVVEPEPAPAVVVDEPEVVIETATAPEPVRAQRPRGRYGR